MCHHSLLNMLLFKIRDYIICTELHVSCASFHQLVFHFFLLSFLLFLVQSTEFLDGFSFFFFFVQGWVFMGLYKAWVLTVLCMLFSKIISPRTW